MRKITIDVDEWINDAEEGKYKINTSSYVKGCNDVLDYYIKKLKYTAFVYPDDEGDLVDD